jgi:uncharacterized protein (TIGR02757 family)
LHLQRLKSALDRLYESFDFNARLRNDPIEFPHRYSKAEDIEVVGLISACLAYGKIDLFKRVIEEILKRIKGSPSEFLGQFSLKREASFFKGIRYRFQSEEDIAGLFFVLSELIGEYGRLEEGFYHFFDGKEISSSISGIRDYAIKKIEASDIEVGQGFFFFFPSPKTGACKRMNLFLRWMVRDRDIDFGIWRSFRKDQLVIPLDTHIARIGRCLGLTKRRTQGWKMAIEITQSLRLLDPEDPLKYDFALCHHGVIGICKRCKRDRKSCLLLGDAGKTDMKT